MQLCAKRTALRLATLLLSSARSEAEARGQPFHALAPAFLASWRALLERVWPPGSAEPLPELSLQLLADRVLLDASCSPAQLRYFPEAELSTEPAQRFKALFQARASWRDAELIPFLEPIAHPPHRKLMDMVAMFCRVTFAPDKTRSFSERK